MKQDGYSNVVNKLEDQVKLIIKRMKDYPSEFKTEDDTRNYVINPILKAIGFDVNVPTDVRSEYGEEILKGSGINDSLDYLIKKDNNPIMIIEAKTCSKDLTIKGAGLKEGYKQLQGYFSALLQNNSLNTKNLRVGIVTNGVKWFFYMLGKSKGIGLQNKVYFEFNINDYTKTDLEMFARFSREAFSFKSIEKTLLNKVMVEECTDVLMKESTKPDRIYSLFSQEIKDANLNKSLEEDREVIDSNIKEAFARIFGIKIGEHEDRKTQSEIDNNDKSKKFVDAEREALGIIKAIAAQMIDPDDVTYEDYQTTCAIFVESKGNKNGRICTLKNFDNARNKYEIKFSDDEVITITKISELYKYSEKVLSILKTIIN